jgi:hypothetical protein
MSSLNNLYDNINAAKIAVHSTKYTDAISYVNGYLIRSVIMLAFQLIFSSIGLTFAKGLFSLRIFIL